MNIIELNIMNLLFQEPYKNQRTLSAASGYSLGKVNQALASLQKEGFLDAKHTLTDKAFLYKKEHVPHRAVILAAGYGLRMIPINREVPKGLLEVRGEILIERLIRQLKEAGISDITVVVGFMKEAYEYLIDDFGVRLLVNRDYSQKNNLHSLALASDILDDNTYIVPCDIYSEENPFSSHEMYSWYLVTDLPSEESEVRVNRKSELVAVDPEETGNQMIGIAYLWKEDGRRLAERISLMDCRRRYSDSFWEEGLMEQGKMIVHAKVLSSRRIHEINTYEDLRSMDSESRSLQSDVLLQIASALHCEPDSIHNIEMLKKGMTNRSFLFEQNDRRYIMRIPGEGSDLLINRRQEHDVYEAIHDLQLSDRVIFFDPETGCKMTEYLENAHCCDWENPEELTACMQVLRNFHQSPLQVSHSFDLFERIAYYENLWDGQPSCYRDYQKTLANIRRLQPWLEKQPQHRTLCHIDSVPDNFLINDDGIFLIDWEYSGMADSDLDIAMFSVYTLADKAQIDRIIDAYYTEGCPDVIRHKIYGYIAAAGLLWSNWCEYKHHQGVEFGEYSLKQYRYAKEFFHYVEPLLAETTAAESETADATKGVLHEKR